MMSSISLYWLKGTSMILMVTTSMKRVTMSMTDTTKVFIMSLASNTQMSTTKSTRNSMVKKKKTSTTSKITSLNQQIATTPMKLRKKKLRMSNRNTNVNSRKRRWRKKLVASSQSLNISIPLLNGSRNSLYQLNGWCGLRTCQGK